MNYKTANNRNVNNHIFNSFDFLLIFNNFISDINF